MAEEKQYARSVALDRKLQCYPPDPILTKVHAQVERTGESVSSILTDALRCYYERYPQGIAPKPVTGNHY